MVGLSFINNHMFLTAVIVVSLFLVITYFLNSSKNKDSGNKPTQQKPSPPSNPGEGKDTVLKRMGRGFNVMREKISATGFVQNIKAEQESPSQDVYSTDLSGFNAEEEPIQNKKMNSKPTKNPYATDFNNSMDIGF